MRFKLSDGPGFVRPVVAAIIVLAVVIWAVFYLPTTPSYAVLGLKRAIDARDPASAAQYVNFVAVVKHAGYEMLRDDAKAAGSGAGNGLSELFGKAAVDALAQPAANIARAWAEREVSEGAPQVQIPALAVAGAVLLLHRDGDTAYTRFTDRKGRTWKIHMARNAAGQWQVTEVDHIAQLLKQLGLEGSGTEPAPFAPAY